MSEPTSSSAVTALITIPAIKESAAARGGVSAVALEGDLGFTRGYKYLFSS